MTFVLPFNNVSFNFLISYALDTVIDMVEILFSRKKAPYTGNKRHDQ